MMVNERQRRILEELEKKPDITVRELAALLYVSEPIIRQIDHIISEAPLPEHIRRHLPEKR